MKQNKRTLKMILSLALALVLVFSLGSMAFAANTEVTDPDANNTPTGAYQSDQANGNVEAAISKDLVIPHGATTPAAVFYFDVVPAPPATSSVTIQRPPAYATASGVQSSTFTNAVTDASKYPTMKTATQITNGEYGFDQSKLQIVYTAGETGVVPLNTGTNPTNPAVPAGQNAQHVEKNTGNMLPDAKAWDNSGPGLYVYKITENYTGVSTASRESYFTEDTTGAYEVNGVNTEKMHYSKAIYTMYLWIEPNPDYDATTNPNVSKNIIKYVSVVMTQGNYVPGSEGVDQAEGSKVKPEPWTRPGQPGDPGYDEIQTNGRVTFMNAYDRTKGDDHQDPELNDLIVSKKVNGSVIYKEDLTAQSSAEDRANAKDRFIINLKLTKADSAEVTVLKGWLKDENGDPVTTLQAANRYVECDTSGNPVSTTVAPQVEAAAGPHQGHWYIPFEVGTATPSTTDPTLITYTSKTASVDLWFKGDQKIVFEDIPTGTEFETQETIAGARGLNIANIDVQLQGLPLYNTPTIDDTNGARSHPQWIKENPGATIGNYSIITNGANPPPTGILMNNLPFFVLIALSAAAILAYVVVRGTKREGVEQ